MYAVQRVGLVTCNKLQQQLLKFDYFEKHTADWGLRSVRPTKYLLHKQNYAKQELQDCILQSKTYEGFCRGNDISYRYN